MQILLTLLGRLATRYLPHLLVAGVAFTIGSYCYILKLRLEACQEDARNAELATAAIYAEALAMELAQRQQQFDEALAVLQRKRQEERRLRKKAEEGLAKILASQKPEVRNWLDGNMPADVVDGLRKLPTYPNSDGADLYSPADTGRTTDASDTAIPVGKHEWRSPGGIHARVTRHSGREPTTHEAAGILAGLRDHCAESPGKRVEVYTPTATWIITCPAAI